jgi:hypothetical protein
MMSDIVDTSFLMPYPIADVYGIGIAGSPVPESSPAARPTQVEAQNGITGAQSTGSVPSSGPSERTEGLGRYVDVRV